MEIKNAEFCRQRKSCEVFCFLSCIVGERDFFEVIVCGFDSANVCSYLAR